MRVSRVADWLRALIAGAALALPAPPAHAQRAGPEELALLPPYCRYTFAYQLWGPEAKPTDPAQLQHWQAVIGPTLTHMHHYCYGILKSNRASIFVRKYTRQFRMSELGQSIGEYDYVIQRAPPDFVLLPEILTKKGESLVRLGKGALAIGEFERAIQLRPDYWPPYAQLSDYYRDMGDTNKAREVLQQGLTAAPGSKTLKDRLGELAGAGKKQAEARAARKPAKPDQQPPDAAGKGAPQGSR